MSTDWIDKGLTVIEAKSALGDLAIQQNKLTKDNGDSGEGDPDAKYRAEYNASLSTFDEMGLTLEDYIYSRKVEDGKAKLTHAKA